MNNQLLKGLFFHIRLPSLKQVVFLIYCAESIAITS